VGQELRVRLVHVTVPCIEALVFTDLDGGDGVVINDTQVIEQRDFPVGQPVLAVVLSADLPRSSAPRTVAVRRHRCGDPAALGEGDGGRDARVGWQAAGLDPRLMQLSKGQRDYLRCRTRWHGAVGEFEYA
jgi:hypothetical protein